MRGLDRLRTSKDKQTEVQELLVGAAKKAASTIANLVAEEMTFSGEGFPATFRVAKGEGQFVLWASRNGEPERMQSAWTATESRKFAEEVQEGLLERMAVVLDGQVTEMSKFMGQVVPPTAKSA